MFGRILSQCHSVTLYTCVSVMCVCVLCKCQFVCVCLCLCPVSVSSVSLSHVSWCQCQESVRRPRLGGSPTASLPLKHTLCTSPTSQSSCPHLVLVDASE